MKKVVFFFDLQEIEHNSRDEMIEEKHKDCQIPTDNDSVVDNYSPRNLLRLLIALRIFFYLH